MSIYSKEKTKQHLSIVRRMLALDRNATLDKLQENLKANGLELSIPYIWKLRKKAEGYWRNKYDYTTKQIMLAQADEWFDYLIQQLRKIVQDEQVTYNYTVQSEQEGGNKRNINKIRTFSQINRIQAIREIRETIKLMLQLRMDFGIVDRKLGEIDANLNGISLREIAKELYAKNPNREIITIDPETGVGDNA